jgi:hypothetical protein
MKTLQELKSACKEKGIKVSKKTLSWGPHLTFSIDENGVVEFFVDDISPKEKAEVVALVKRALVNSLNRPKENSPGDLQARIAADHFSHVKRNNIKW